MQTKERAVPLNLLIPSSLFLDTVLSGSQLSLFQVGKGHNSPYCREPKQSVHPEAQLSCLATKCFFLKSNFDFLYQRKKFL